MTGEGGAFADKAARWCDMGMLRAAFSPLSLLLGGCGD